jgi:2-methylcitrate dehydratase PrpD
LPTAAERLADFACDLTLDRIPPDVRHAAALHLLDALGCGLAAHALGAAPYATAALAETNGGGPATAIGMQSGVPPTDAALTNGALCHALDFDDTHTAAIAHVTVAVSPAALAAAEATEAGGAEVIAALVAGSEVTIRVGMAAGDRFQARGFHTTALSGVLGATVAACRLRGLDAERTSRALGIAGSMASGLLEFLGDGSATKRLHPGWAAHAGLMAARLAAHGATGPTTVLEGRFGVYRAFTGEDRDIEGQLADLGERWETPRIAFKPYPACHYMHASLDAAARLTAEERVDPADVEEIVALVPQAAVDLVLEPADRKLRPASDYEAKFSLPYSIAALLLRGRVDVTSYTDDAITDPEVLELAGRVRYEVRDYPTFPRAMPGGVRILTRDGRAREAELPHQRGGPDLPMPEADVLAKFRTNAELALPVEAVNTLESDVLTLELAPGPAGLRMLRSARSAL